MLIAALTMVCGNVLATEKTWVGAESTALPTEIGSDITLSWVDGSADQGPSFNSTKKAVSMKNGNKLTIAGADNNVTISKIVFAFDSSTNPGLSASVGTNANDYSANTTTWTGEANSITFTANGAKLIKSIEVTYTGTAAPVVKTPVLSITNITNMNTTVALDGESGKTLVVYYENTGNGAAANAKLTLYVGGVENKVVEIGEIAAGATNQWKNVTYDVTKIEKGTHEVYVSLTADGVDAVNSTKTNITFTKADPVPAFSIAAEAVTVPYNAESYNVVATLTETNNVAASNVKVELRKNITDVLTTQTVESLAAGGNTQVTLTVAKESFETGEKTYYLYVNDKYLASVKVTFEEAPIVETKDLAITEVLGTIKLAEETNNIRVTVKNNGNVDITDAAVVLKNGETTLGQGTVSAKAGLSGWTNIAVDKTGLEAGTINVTATVTVEGDATPADNTVTQEITVEAVPAAQPNLVFSGEPVEVNQDAETITVKVKVENNGEAAAENVEVKLIYNNAELCASQTINSLAVNASTELTFTFDNPFKSAGDYEVQAITADNKFGGFIKVTLKEVIVPVVDINLIDIRGLEYINLKETNTVMVTFQNNSNFDVENATITLKMNDVQVGEPQTIAKGETSKSFTLPTEGLEAGVPVTLVATLSVENNKEGNTTEVNKKLQVVSGEEEPVAEIAINPIKGWNVEAGEQTVNVPVTIYNNGEVDAKDVKIEFYHNYGDGLCEPQIIDVPAGEQNYKMLTFSFNYIFEQGKSYTFTVFTNYKDAESSNNMQEFTLTCPLPVAELSLAKIADIAATTEEDVKINAVVKNTSAMDAQNVRVGVYTQDENYQYQLVGIQNTIETIAAGESANTEFNLGKLAAGNYKYYVRIVNQDNNMDNNMQDVTVKVTEPIVPVVNVTMTAIQGISNIDLAEGAVNNISVWIANEGNQDVEEATIAVKLNETDLTSQTVAVQAGKNANASFTLPLEGLTAGTKATVTATVTVAENTAAAESITISRDYDVVNSSVATEPVYTVTVEPVEIELGAEKFDVKATVKNTSNIDATNVAVNLFHNQVIATETIDALAGGAEKEVTFTDVENPFTKVGTYSMYVQAPKAQAEVTVTVKEPYVEPVYDLAITAIQGSLDLNYETGNISIAVKNNGNQDMKDAVVKLTAGEKALGETTVNVKAGETGYAFFAVATEGLTAGTLNVTAAVEVENDATPADNSLSADITVNAKDAAKPTFSVTAENVSVPYGAKSFSIIAQVKNTSEIDASKVSVVLRKSLDEVETQEIPVLSAGGDKFITFTLDETHILEAGKTATYYVQVANAVQAEVTVTFEQAPVEQKIDLAITSFTGTLSVEAETNYLTVFVENLGTVAVTDAAVTLKSGQTVLGTGKVSAKAGSTGICSVAIPGTALQAEMLEVTAIVEVEGDIDLTNNKLTKDFEVALPDPNVSITVEDVTVAPETKSFIIPVKVKNLNKNYAAKNVRVMIYNGFNLIGQTTLERLGANAEETVNVNIELEEAYTAEQTLKAWVTGFSETELVEFKLLIGTTDGINAIKAQYGENVNIYTINGQKVERINKAGIYVVNGKKIVIK